ncbi:MAG: UDP-glucose/iron transport system permease protein [Actinomycetota bacterium]|nr:UDP-glucose/iron transport system permease protein [Actinomycetota bacterium]
MAVLALITLVVMWSGRIELRLDYLGAALRSVVQLVAVALVVAWVFRNPAGTAVYLAVMLLAATATSMRRIGVTRADAWRVLVPLACGATVAVAPVLATGALPVEAQSVLPFTAQIIGGSMTAASLAGSRFRDDAHAHWEVVEGYLALGATPRQAITDIGRRAAGRSLIPALDQMRSAGLVVLPGAFVGMLLGGATPAQAAQVQLLVLFALMAASATSAVVLVTAFATRFGAVRPDPA